MSRGGELELILTLEPGEDGKWSATGFMSAGGVFCPYSEMTGMGDEALDLLDAVASSVLPGATVLTFSPETFNENLVTVGFEMELEPFESDGLDRTKVRIGDPTGGIVSQLPSDVHLYHERRGSPVVLSGEMKQRMVLRLMTGDREVVQLPTTLEIENEVGSFAVSATENDVWVTIERVLTFNSTSVQPTKIAPEAWPDLRALLLEESDASGRTVLLK
jgi:hypothetical protein